ncbi:hypothetical protein V1477_014902, partial [Vespula maculifrons]
LVNNNFFETFFVLCQYYYFFSTEICGERNLCARVLKGHKFRLTLSGAIYSEVNANFSVISKYINIKHNVEALSFFTWRKEVSSVKWFLFSFDKYTEY